jgi:hypothetical protein
MTTKTIQQKEMKILEDSISHIEENLKKTEVNDPKLKEILNILEKFIKKKELICYGGLAINNILPYQDQFYDFTKEIPDYDVFSKNALEDAKELADLFFKKGFEEVEAKSGVHSGTYKVFVNFIPIADITHVDKNMFKKFKHDSIKIDNIYYSSPNFLKMAAHLELSRPEGDVSRWNKVYKRLQLLNKNYPMDLHGCGKKSLINMFLGENKSKNKDVQELIYYTVRDTLINRNVVFFGGFAMRLFLREYDDFEIKEFKKISDFDVISPNAESIATILKERLEHNKVKNVQIKEEKPVGELLNTSYEVLVDNDIVARIFLPTGCHNYNKIKYKSKEIKVATVDTMLNYYLAFMYSTMTKQEQYKILCMSEFLTNIVKKNRSNNEGMLKRFSLNCIGTQKSLALIRKERSEIYDKLKNDKNSKMYQKYFLKYYPSKNVKKTKKSKKVNKTKTLKKKKNEPKGLVERLTSYM